MTQSIRSNIKRLVSDAKVLHKAGRTESSLLLMIFSFEQVGKILMKMSQKKGRGNHKAKQRAAAGHLLAVIALEAFNKAGYEFVPNQPPMMEPSDSIKAGTSEHNEMIASVTELIDSDGFISLANTAFGHSMYEIRNWLMYSDGRTPDQSDIEALHTSLTAALPRMLDWIDRFDDSWVAERTLPERD